MSSYRPWRHGDDSHADTSRHVPTLRYGRPQQHSSTTHVSHTELNLPHRHISALLSPSPSSSSNSGNSDNASHREYQPKHISHVKSHRTSTSSSSSVSTSDSSTSSSSPSSSSSTTSVSDGIVHSSVTHSPHSHSTTSDTDDLDADSVVPPRMHRRRGAGAERWRRQPSHRIVLSLLQHRGVYLPRYRTVMDYHMAALFLHYLDICRVGAYFVHYEADRWPRERFFRLRMLPLDRVSARDEHVPHLVCTLHAHAVDIIAAVPLQDLIGVTAGSAAPNFRPFCLSPDVIFGCRQGRGHRARLPTKACFTLWFRDRHDSALVGIAKNKASLLPCTTMDLLTCDGRVFEIWTTAFRALVSVNSTTVVELPLSAQNTQSGNGNPHPAAHTTTTTTTAAK